MQERISIEEAIREAGLKKKYVANELGVSETYINEYLKKPGSISVKNASIICKLTNKKLNEMILEKTLKSIDIFLSLNFKIIEV